jgi:hypothetical protein
VWFLELEGCALLFFLSWNFRLLEVGAMTSATSSNHHAEASVNCTLNSSRATYTQTNAYTSDQRSLLSV